MSLSLDDRNGVRADAARYLKERGFVVPPFPVNEALEGEQLQLASVSLEDALRNVGLAPQEIEKVDAMLHVEERLVVLRQGLHPQGRKWGAIHELAHYVLPAHRDLLYYCSLLDLPPRLQKHMELEADAFTSDLIFFADRFREEAHSSDTGLARPIQLAESYGASLHSALVRYVEDSPRPCCLLVWTILDPAIEHVLRLRYWVQSPSWRGSFRIGQELNSQHSIVRAFVRLKQDAALAIMPHQVTVGDRVLHAESFTNSYQVFTLLF